MFNLIGTSRAPGRIAAITGLVLASSILTSAAFAGSCPADKMKADVREPVKFAAVGVTDTTLGAIDLEKEPAQIKDRQLRFRKLTIAPNGVVAPGTATATARRSSSSQRVRSWNMPAIARPRSSTRPATSGPRPVAPRTGGRTSANKTVVLYVGDLLHDKSDKNM